MAREILKVSNEILMKYVCDNLAAGKFVTIRVRGNSMLPFLRDNKDCVTLKKVERNHCFTNGDIILFHYNGKYLLHRIIHQKKEKLYVRGDNRWTKEYEVITAQAVIGLVYSVNRNGHYILCDRRLWRWCSKIWIICFTCLSYLHHKYKQGIKLFK